jgi:chlorophyllide a oxygenase
VPDFVKFHAHKVLSGNWDPYPIDMEFQPPCMVSPDAGACGPTRHGMPGVALHRR